MITIVKVGGNVINDDLLLKKFLRDFSQIQTPKILIHGGGKLASDLSLKMGVTPKMIDGRRITDEETLDIIVMTYAGLINKRIVTILQSLDCNAIGLTGADANIIPATKRPVNNINYGFVGDVNVDEINGSQILNFLSSGLIPVFSPLTHNYKTLLNTNADTIAASIAIALSSKNDVQLIYCFEKNGVLNDINDPDSVISDLNYPELEKMIKNGIIHTGMLPKLENGYNALKAGAINVKIKNSNQLLEHGGTELKL